MCGNTNLHVRLFWLVTETSSRDSMQMIPANLREKPNSKKVYKKRVGILAYIVATGHVYLARKFISQLK